MDATQAPQSYDIDGQPVRELGPGLVFCPKRGFGQCLTFRGQRAANGKEVAWRTMASLCEQAGTAGVPLPQDQMRARMKAGWSYVDIIKPDGWERVVDARRHGITYRNKHQTLTQWANELNLTLAGLTARLARPGMPMHKVLSPGLPNRYTSNRAPEGIPTHPPTTPSGGTTGVFWYEGAVDTLTGHCKAAGISVDAVKYRVRERGMSVPEALSKRAYGFKRKDSGVRCPRRALAHGVPVPKADPRGRVVEAMPGSVFYARQAQEHAAQMGTTVVEERGPIDQTAIDAELDRMFSLDIAPVNQS